MTTGEQLKIDLGLENFDIVKIARVLVSSKKILTVYFNSYNTIRPITNSQVKRAYRVASVWDGDDLNKGKKYPTMTPLLDIEDYKGTTRNALIVPIDMSGYYRIKDDKFSKIFEDVDQDKKEIRLNFSGKLEEFLQINDLIKNAGLSDFSKTFRKERSSIMGNENKVAKLVDIDINKEKDYVMFYWLAEATEKYPKDHKFKEVDPENNFKLKTSIGKTYTVSLKILDFFKWLDTYDIEGEVTRKDIKDIMSVADIQVFSTDPSFHWQGMNYNVSQLEGSINPTNIAPKHWNKNEYHGDGNAFLSKHMTGIFNQLAFWGNPMSSMLTKRLQDRNLI